MKKFFLALAVIISLGAAAQNTLARPKLVVGVVIDQMRWDYLYRYYDRYSPGGGFKRMLSQGHTCENTYIPYAPTVTACGHSTIYTGSVPAITGITGNTWWDRQQMRSVYCTEDKSVNTVGSASALGKMSPANLLANTIGDELRMATNYRSKVIGVAIKDRGGILPAGHSANAAYWYDNTTGDWITSTYYMQQLPQWVIDFNNQHLVNKYYEQGWNLLYPLSTYSQSTEDEKKYENKLFGNSFPYNLSAFVNKDFGKIASTPMGNTLTTEYAKAVIAGEQLGRSGTTDMLTVSYSSTDYVGHSFGPNSVEQEDDFLRLDRELGSLLDYLDAKIGKNQYVVFLSADHGVAHVPEYLNEHHMPGGRFMIGDFMRQLNKGLAEKFNTPNLVVSDDNYQIHFNHKLIDSAGLDEEKITSYVIGQLSANPAIARAFPLQQLNTTPLPETVRGMLNNGYYTNRSGDVQFILKPGFIEGYSNTGTTHGLWNPYDAHIPLLWYGWGIKQGKTIRETYMTDIAPTIATLLHIQVPNGCIGHPIAEVLR